MTTTQTETSAREALIAGLQEDGLDRFAATFVGSEFFEALYGREPVLTEDVRSDLIDVMLEDDADIESVAWLVDVLAARLDKAPIGALVD